MGVEETANIVLDVLYDLKDMVQPDRTLTDDDVKKIKSNMDELERLVE